ncbi:MAG: O-antigen ligase family protein [Cetobacterium sp.]
MNEIKNIINKENFFDNLIIILATCYLFFLFRRGGDTKYIFSILLTIVGVFCAYKNKFVAIKIYKWIYIFGIIYLVLLSLVFYFSKNKTNDRIEDFLGMTLYSVVYFLAVLNIEVKENMYLKIIPLITFLSLDSLYRGVQDIYIHRDRLAWYRISGKTYTTIYAGEIGVYVLLGIFCIYMYKNIYIKLGYSIYSLLCVYVLFYTKSRNSMLMIPITLVIIYFFKNMKRGIIVAIFTILILIFSIKNATKIKGLERLATISTVEKIKKDARYIIFKDGINNGEKNLLLGEGFYKYKEHTLKTSRAGYQPHYHNIVVETFATQGLLTTLSYILFIYSLYYYLFKSYIFEKNKKIKKIRLTILGTTMFVFFYGMAEPVFYFTKLYMVLFMILTIGFFKINRTT